MKDPQPGELRERVTIERDTGTVAGLQGTTPSWTARFTVYAAIRQLSQRETLAADHVASEEKYKVIIRYSHQTSDLTTKDRLAWRGQTLNIEAVDNPAGRNRWLVITAQLTE